MTRRRRWQNSVLLRMLSLGLLMLRHKSECWAPNQNVVVSFISTPLPLNILVSFLTLPRHKPNFQQNVKFACFMYNPHLHVFLFSKINCLFFLIVLNICITKKCNVLWTKCFLSWITKRKHHIEKWFESN